MNAEDYEELNAIKLLLEFYEMEYKVIIENEYASFRLFSPSFITNDLRELSNEVLKRTETKGDE